MVTQEKLVKSMRFFIGSTMTLGLLTAGTGSATAVSDTSAVSAAPDRAIGTPLIPASSAGLTAQKPLDTIKPPKKGSVKHKALTQATPCWCAPASVQMSLRTFGFLDLKQSTLAEKMKTSMKECFTTGGNLTRVYNSYLSKKGYKVTQANAKNPTGLMLYISYDVGVLKRAVPLAVWGKSAPWIKAKKNFGHVVVVNGYNKSKGTVTLWDPARTSYGGRHTVNIKRLAEAAQEQGMFYVTLK
ncbi:C39 family peptidase [Nonomuraea diastatica]|uniref:Peptidase C39-like domain-containing protein n=1 Tax=Nonomuraea diastatica TaxID=1848329 RepID=A0A4R4VZI9_9ACTN|nr:C39 family peptidase [Nonomuraea diastatica]TDD08015.1 hypothetical protein E1294_47735 [Nonomuraea diastatica]